MEITYIICDRCRNQITRKDTPSPECFELRLRRKGNLTQQVRVICVNCASLLVDILDFLDIGFYFQEPVRPPQAIEPGVIEVE